MSDQDRGAYTPQSDAPLAFDARRAPRGGGGGGGGGGGPVPMTLLISGLVLVVLIIAIAFFYRSGVRSPAAGPQVVGVPVGPTKAPAPASDQPSDPAAGLQVYKSEVTPPSEGATTPKFAPAPEKPAPRPAPQAVAPQAALPQAATDLAAPPLASATPKAAPTKSVKVVKTLKPAVSATAAPAAPTTSAEHAAESEAIGATHAAPAGASHAVVQIGAFSSAALADKGWGDTAALLPSAMAGKTKKVESITKDGTVFYRAFVGGFGSKTDAQAFCASLKAAGKVCIVK
jgi:hypothetical protein